MDRGACWPAIHRIIKSWTSLSDATTTEVIGTGNSEEIEGSLGGSFLGSGADLCVECGERGE